MKVFQNYKLSLYIMAVFYVGAGANHFVHPDFYLSVMPAGLPYHDFLNVSSGLVEIILGFLLIPEQTRRISAWTIIAILTVFFFVIHVPMCFAFYGKDNFMFWIAVVRIPLQVVLIGWAWKFARFRKS